MAPRNKADDEAKGKGEFVHGCGQKFAYGAAYTKHALKCDGTPPATSGRIASQATAAPAPSRKKRKAEPRRPAKPRIARATKRARRPRMKKVAPAATPSTITLTVDPQLVAGVIDEAIQDLTAVRDEFDKKIRELEALKP